MIRSTGVALIPRTANGSVLDGNENASLRVRRRLAFDVAFLLQYNILADVQII